MQSTYKIVHVDDDADQLDRLGLVFSPGFQRDGVTFEQRPDFAKIQEELAIGELAEAYILDNDIEGQRTRGGDVAQQIHDMARELGKEVLVVTLLGSNPDGVRREYGKELDERGIAALHKMRDSSIAGFYVGNALDLAINHSPEGGSPLIIPTFTQWASSPGVGITIGNGMPAWDVDYRVGRAIRGETGGFYQNPRTFIDSRRDAIEGRLDAAGKAELARIFYSQPGISKEGGRPGGPRAERM